MTVHTRQTAQRPSAGTCSAQASSQATLRTYLVSAAFRAQWWRWLAMIGRRRYGRGTSERSPRSARCGTRRPLPVNVFFSYQIILKLRLATARAVCRALVAALETLDPGRHPAHARGPSAPLRER